MTRFFRIHPAVGVARVGNSPDEFFVGPERPGEPPNFDLAQKKFRPFKDSQGRIKRQAARFRVFEYEQKNGVIFPVREVTAGGNGVVSIKWKVHLANRKAAFFTFDGQDGADGNWKGPEPEEGQPRVNLRNAHVKGAAERERLLVIDPGLKTVSGRNQPPVPFTNTKTHIPIATLGELRTDENGNLLVLGGLGQANVLPQGKLIDDYVNNDHWFDDMSDGPVSAEVTYTEGGTTQTATLEGATGSWVLVGPPDFAPSVSNVVRLIDTMWDVAVRFPQVDLFETDGLFSQGLLARLRQQRKDWDEPTKSFKTYKPSFRLEIYPILDRALQHRHVHNPEASKAFHGTFAGIELDLGTVSSTKGKRLRKTIFNYMRDPSNNNNEPLLMPKGLGDNYSDFEGPRPGYFMTLTSVQYALLKRWSEGAFEEDWNELAHKTIDPAITAEGLERAALENSVGGPFFPGIDCSWMVRLPELYASPFRIKHSGVAFPNTARLPIGPGFFSQQMALPWQADFFQCKKQFFPQAHVKYEGEGMYHMWWSAHRPDDVYEKKGDFQMVSWTRTLETVAAVEAKKPELQKSATEDVPALDLAMYIQMLRNWPQLGFVISEGDAHFETQERSAPTGIAAVRNATRIRLKSWKTDYLQRTDAAQGVTTSTSGAGTEWLVEWVGNNTLRLKSSKGDYLQRTDAAQGVTTGATGVNTVWIIEANTDKFTLKSSKGDCLHRPDAAPSVTTWGEGIGNLWHIEVLAPTKV
ncbi:LodA/GoxA family CTQ-dependent oxidase [Archangium lipolyticum]|uniref:LodA/GoxA family CTQ-dependent oxidase n=1 Tax=Archangium lipolyticum TaxID=2970465 RepID=UPI00214A49C5|nr:LodA/GoxA family CTQ-dependent oxidase [Archangium lipolyticum]